jgi:hypothetical protein
LKFRGLKFLKQQIERSLQNTKGATKLKMLFKVKTCGILLRTKESLLNCPDEKNKLIFKTVKQQTEIVMGPKIVFKPVTESTK